MTTYTTLTRRTNDPKLAWLQMQLDKAGVPNRRNKESFHAPILEIDEAHEDAAWDILNPVDDIDDDDPRWARELQEAEGDDTEQCDYEFWV